MCILDFTHISFVNENGNESYICNFNAVTWDIPFVEYLINDSKDFKIFIATSNVCLIRYFSTTYS